MRRFWAVVVAACALAYTARADDHWSDPPVGEVAETVEALASTDDARRREAVETLATYGPDVLADLLTATSVHATNEAVWTGLREALGRWEGHDAADHLSAARTTWPPAARSRLDVLVHDLRMAEPLPPIPDFGESPKDVAAKVEAVLARYDGPPHYTLPNPDAAELAKLGRDAVPMLLSVLRTYGGDQGNGRFKAYVAADALALIGDERVVHVIGLLLAEGRPAAARVFHRPESSGALPALLAAVERDVLDSDVLDALAAQRQDPHVDLTVLGWLERNPAGREVGSVAEFLARRRFEDAVPALQSALALNRHAWVRAKIAESLAALDDPSGIDALVDIVEARGSTWARRTAGEALNEIVGRRVLLSDSGSPDRDPEGNFDQAAAEFRDWWNRNCGRLVFDREQRRWRLSDDESFGIAPAPPEITARVREVLAALDGLSTYSPRNRQVMQIAALGRDAIPALLRELVERGPMPSWGHARTAAAVSALSLLVEDRDTPLLGRLLERRLPVAHCLGAIGSAAARDALLTAVEHGHVDPEVVEALEVCPDGRAIDAALVEWVRRHGETDDAVGAVAQFLADRGTEDALDALSDVLQGRVDPFVRPELAEAVARLGGSDGIEALVAVASAGGRRGHDAAIALGHVVGRPVHGAEGAKGRRRRNIDEASAWLRAWWEEQRGRLTFDPVARKWVEPGDAPTFDPGSGPPEVAGRVEAILLRVRRRDAGWLRGVGDPQPGGDPAAELAAVGRDAIPALVQCIRRSTPFLRRPSAECRTAAEALAKLRTDADIGPFAALLREGRLAMTVALRGCRDSRAKEALLAVVARGFDDPGVTRALESHPPDGATWDAIRAWLYAPSAETGSWLGRYLVCNATPDAAPLLREMVAAARVDSATKVRCAVALAQLGERDGIEALLALVDVEPLLSSPTVWRMQDARSMAAERLNGIFGQNLFVDRTAPAPDAEYADAAARFRAWWSANAADLRFDRRRRVWTLGATTDPAPAAPAPPATEIDTTVQALLADVRADDAAFREWRHSIIGHPRADDFVTLGREALPSMVDAIRRGFPWMQDHDDRAIHAVEDALLLLAEIEDTGTMLELLGEGRLAVVPWFRTHPTDRSRDALVAVVRRGFLSVDVLDALVPWRDDVLVQEAVAVWAQRYGARDTDPVERVTMFLAAPAAGGTTPVLPDLLDRPIPASTRWRLAARMTEDGSVAAAAALVDMFTAPETLSDEAAAHVALILNRIAGDELVSVSAPNPAAPTVELGANPPRTIRLTSDPGRVRSHAEAAEAVRAWWTENGERLGFDVATGAWSIRR